MLPLNEGWEKSFFNAMREGRISVWHLGTGIGHVYLVVLYLLLLLLTKCIIRKSVRLLERYSITITKEINLAGKQISVVFRVLHLFNTRACALINTSSEHCRPLVIMFRLLKWKWKLKCMYEIPWQICVWAKALRSPLKSKGLLLYRPI